ncbi:unnamed protein product [Rotaria sordida]|uniref:Uncharacterized protein n=1 Tax=Rotaria sordida TaxID=392033 RepID=A0A819CVH1_9BILA|nr:unnamed protein product [Rotaria sordida]
MKYYKNHPPPKRSKLSTIEPNTNVEACEQLVIERPQTEECENETVIISCDKRPLVSPSNIIRELPQLQSTNTLFPNSSRRATISLIPPTSTRLVDVSTINTTPVPNKLPLTTTSTNTFLYHDGRMLLTSVPAQPVVAVHKALLPRAAKKMSNSIPATPNNTTSTATSKNTTSTATSNSTTSAATSNNTTSTTTKQESNHTFNAYDKDIHRLRSIVKPKGKASQNISITGINVLLRSTHKLRRQMLLEKKDAELSLKAFQHQEIFHQEALIYEYSLIKNKLFSYEKLEHEARTLVDIYIRKYSISNEHFLTERDFQAIQKLCNDLNE